MIECGRALPRGLFHLLQLGPERYAAFPWGLQSKDGARVVTGRLDQTLKGREGSPRASISWDRSQNAFGLVRI
jgi:hypothetical protein